MYLDQFNYFANLRDCILDKANKLKRIYAAIREKIYLSNARFRIQVNRKKGFFSLHFISFRFKALNN